MKVISTILNNHSICIRQLHKTRFSFPTAQAFSIVQRRMSITQAPKVLGVPAKMRANPAVMKMDTPDFHSIFTDELRKLAAVFEKNNHEIRIAGGAVRDLIMHIKPKDIDFATTATPAEMKEMFEKENIRMINSKGEKHGTITARINDKENYEVTTLRIDVVTDGRHAEVQFTTDWQLDANRRDLTINSMFLGFDGTIYDYFYGYEDLLNRRVLFVGDADVRIKEDYLRILRYFRFYGRISKDSASHDVDTLKAIQANAEGLSRISGERIWAELQKIVVGNFGCDLVVEMYKCGLLKYCGLGSEPNIKELQRLYSDLDRFPKPHLPILYLIGLLHTHQDAMRLHERLKLSAYERDLALFITQQKDKVDVDLKSLRDYQKLCLQPFAKRDYVEELLKYCNKLELFEALKNWKTPNFPLNGNLLKDRGCPQGKKMGLIMNQLKLVWADSDFSLTGDELLEHHLPKVLDRMTPPSPKKKIRKSE